MAGLEDLTSEITTAGAASRTHLEKLHAWFNKVQQTAFTDGDFQALSGLPVLGYGVASRILARDNSGRPRLITVDDLSRITCSAIGPPCGSLDVVRLSLGRRGEAALARGHIRDAERTYAQMFRAIRALHGDEQLQFILLVHLASNVYMKSGNSSSAAGMYMQALRCSQKLYGLQSENNFTMMTNLAIYYENIGRLDDAAALYRRSLRGRINSGKKEDALMNTQELATVYRNMGKNTEALRLIEEAYAGYTQVMGPDHRMTLLTLNNLFVFHYEAGSPERAQSLLVSVIPAMKRVLGLDDPVTWGSVCNFIMYSEDVNFSPVMMQAIEQYMAQNTSASLNVLKSLGDYYGRKGLIRKAMETYRILHEKRVAILGPSHPETWTSLYAYAYALNRLGEIGEALKQYRLLLSQPHARSLLNRDQVEGSQTTMRKLSQKQDAMIKEKAEWGFSVAQKCSRQVCSSSTLRFCSGCNLVRFCSLVCQEGDRSHQGACIPSVTLAESTFTIVENARDEASIISKADFLFTEMQLRRRPRCESARDVFINPKNFTTIRISKRPSHMLSFQPNPNLDLRFMIHSTSPFKWLTPAISSMLCMLNGVEDSFILVAPGDSMMEGLVAGRDTVFGIESGSLDIPDQDLVEFIQTGVAEGDGQFILGFRVIEWAL
ncbi:uncharacterized protein BDW70DRAFT_165340 [Aspergillus foveolatus]|uniref:uncharacterized protein n=1 Tax=Aspergillus foveolatus TaxID=210207 RepID=UPI003CCCBCEC